MAHCTDFADTKVLSFAFKNSVINSGYKKTKSVSFIFLEVMASIHPIKVLQKAFCGAEEDLKDNKASTYFVFSDWQSQLDSGTS